ncbi:MAG: hypothetical protein WBM81_17155, partial [Sedimenticolaceae bacterium]
VTENSVRQEIKTRGDQTSILDLCLLAVSWVLLSPAYCFARIAVTNVKTEAASNHSRANLTPGPLGYAHPANLQ